MQKCECPRQPGGKTIKDELSCYEIVSYVKLKVEVQSSDSLRYPSNWWWEGGGGG